MVSKRTTIFFLLILTITLLPLPAQDSLKNWEEKIAAFETNSNIDSLAYYYQKKANYYKKADNLAAWVYCYWDWQEAEFDNSQQALAILDIALQKTWRKSKTTAESEAILWVQVNRGYHLFQLSRIAAAVKAYEEGLKLYQQYKFTNFESLDYLYLPLGAHYTRLGDNEKARALYENAIQTHPNGVQDSALAGLYNNLGLTYWNEGNQQNAITTFQKGLACQGILPIKLGLLKLSLAQSYLGTRQINKAAHFVEEAIAILDSIKTTSPNEEGIFDYLSGAYLVKAKLLGIKRENTAALSDLQKALAYGKIGRGTSLHRDIAKIQVEIGKCYLQAGNLNQAIAAFNAALGSLIPRFSSSDINALPKPDQLYEENTIYEALEGKADVLSALYQQNKDLKSLQLALECHQLAGQTELLLRRLLQYESSKITLLSQSRQRVEKVIEIAHELFVATSDSYFLYKAWTCAEQAKSTILLEAVQRNRFKDLLTSDDSLLIQERNIRQQTAYFERLLLLEPNSLQRPIWQQQRAELVQQLAETEQQLQQQYPAWATLRRQAESFTATSIQLLRQTLPNHAVVEYFIGEKHIEVFGQSSKGKVVWKRIEQPDSVATKTKNLLLLLQSRSAMQSPNEYRKLAYEIYQSVLQPALNNLDTNTKNILIVPDAWLAFLPFEALYNEAAPEVGWERAPFLLRHCGIHYAFSLAVLESQRQISTKAKYNVLQIAPRFIAKQRGLSPLLHSQEETPVKQACQSQQYFDRQANFEQLKQTAANYRILHLSTHAGVDSNGGLPRVELYDRPAYLPDIYALPLQADLVVLSACQTGLGQFHKGEGVMSLSRAFTYAGVKGLVSSLWIINEAATANIFYRMYGYLQAGVTKPTALRNAKIAYLDDANVPAFQKSPYYWSGLVYLGDERAVKWKNCASYKRVLVLILLGIISVAVVFVKWRKSPSF